MSLQSPTLEFVSWEKTQKCPLVVYADLEAIKVAKKVYPKSILGLEKLKDNKQLALGQCLLILKVSGSSNSTPQKNVFILSSKVIEKYMGSDFCVFVSADGIAKQRFYRGEECIEKLLDTLRGWLFCCYKEKILFIHFKTPTQQREQLLKMTNVLCCICGKGVETTARVIHHCHVSGTIFGVAHSNCNLRARTKKVSISLLPKLVEIRCSRYMETAQTESQ